LIGRLDIEAVAAYAVIGDADSWVEIDALG
jgi:hypothetical protein